jgi:hypothetical protein
VETGGAVSEVPREGDTTYPGLLFGDGGISLDGDADSSVVGDVVYGGVLYDDASLTSASSSRNGDTAPTFDAGGASCVGDLSSSCVLFEEKANPMSVEEEASMNCHEIMVQLLSSCHVDSDVMLSDQRFHWLQKFYCFSMEQRNLFWERLSTQHAEATLVCCSILQPFERIPPEVMSSIYKLFCGLGKKQQRMLLTLAPSGNERAPHDVQAVPHDHKTTKRERDPRTRALQ